MSGKDMKDLIPDMANLDENDWDNSNSDDLNKSGSDKGSYNPMKDSNFQSQISIKSKNPTLQTNNNDDDDEMPIAIISKDQDSDDEVMDRSNLQQNRQSDINFMRKDNQTNTTRISMDRKIDKNYFSVLEPSQSNQPLRSGTTVQQPQRKGSQIQPQFDDSDRESYNQHFQDKVSQRLNNDPSYRRLNEPQETFNAQFISPREDQAKKSMGLTPSQTELFESNLNRPRNRTVKNVTARRQEFDDNDILSQIEKHENEELQQFGQDFGVEDDDEFDGGNMMDRLLSEAENLNEERLRETAYSKANGGGTSINSKSDNNNNTMDQQNIASVDGSIITQAEQSKKSVGARRTNVRFSTSFDDQQVKNSLVQTHSIYRKMRKQSDVSDTVEFKAKEEVKTEVQEQNDQKNDDSLDTEEDFDNYLEQLEEKEKTNNSQQQEEQKKAEENVQSKSIGNISKISGNNKDLIDVIQEVEGEDDENFLDSDDSFTKEFYQTMHQDVLIKGMNPKDQRRSQKLQELTKEDWDYKDLIKLIDWNERRYQEIAKARLKENSSINLKNTQTTDIKIRTFSNFINLNSVSKKMVSERSFSQSRATCLGLSEDLLMIGNTDGQVWMFDRESEEDYSNFTEKSKEFIGNSVTAIDVHPNRTEYVVVGYERGQMVLFDVTEPKKSIKVIKDHHKLAAIINIKFVDWYGKVQPKHVDQVETEQTKTQILQDEDKQAWMFISIDQNGKVIINSVQKVLFVLKASKHVIIDPSKVNVPMFTALACRFKSKFHGKGEYDDLPIIALGNNHEVRIMEARTNTHTDFYTIDRPKKIYNRSSNDFESFQPFSPFLSWGHGHSPVLKDRPHSLLAIAWGPLVQLVVLIDHDDTDTPFIQDGYYILRNFNTVDQKVIRQPKIRKSVRFMNIEDKQDDEDDDLRELLNNKTSKQSMIDLRSRDSLANSISMLNEETKEVVFEEVYDDSQAFNLPNLFIEAVQFLSDSTLMVITQSQEIRVLHTSSFHPETYDADKVKKQTKNSLRQTPIPPRSSVEIEHGLRLPSVMKSEYGGGLFNQTIKFFESKLVVLTSKNIQSCNHLTWQDSITEFKRLVQDDLIKVFSRLLDIYKGKVKGFSGIPDNSTIREIQLKAGLKLNVREIICEKIEKTQMNSLSMQNQAFLNIEGRKTGESDDADVKLAIKKLKEFQEDRRKKYQTLIRISIEFCVELKDCYFLFYDLFLLFKEEQLEDLFIEELEPFILAGKFQEWEIPNDILQEHVINYYKNDPSKSDTLEKIIINLNFNQIEKKIVLEFIHFSEKQFLSTAILFLYTQVIEKKDNTSCVQVLCSLFDLYKKCSKNSQISMIDLQMLREFDYESEEKKQIEKSQIYLGYKILWSIRLFIDGKKFPQGNIREHKWRSYIHDVIQFLSTPEYLKVLLEIDAETLFQVISILFYPSKPFELVQQGRDLISNPSLKSLTHIEFIKDLESYCLQEKVSEHIKNQYLFFVANVVAKSQIQGFEPFFYFNIARELMSKHRRYLEFNKNLHEMSNKKKKKINDQLSKSGDMNLSKQSQIDEMKYLQKTENDFINLFKLSEPLDDLQISDLLKLAEFTQFNQVKVYLYEKKEEYVKCFQMLLTDYKTSETWTAEQQAERVIKWIKEKLALLEGRAEVSQSVLDKNTFEQFKREVTQNIKKIVVMNAKETITLIDEKFSGNHKDMIDQLSRDPYEQMLYLETLLEEQDQTIQETIKNYGLNSSNPKEAKIFIEYLKLHLKLCCLHNKKKVLSIVEKMVKNTYYPIEDCLQICQEHDQIEAAFLLNKKLGKYYESVTQGLSIIQSRVDLTKLKIEVYHAHKKGISLQFPCSHEYLTECNMFDSVFKKILKICKKNSKEVEHDKEELIWFVVIDAVQDIKNNDIVTHKKYCREFFQQRLNIFADALIRKIPFRNFLNHLLSRNKDLEFQEYQDIILQLFGQANSECLILQNANNSIYKVNTELFQQFSQQTMKGILFRQKFCFLCKKFMDQHLYDDAEISTQDAFSSSQFSDEEDDDDMNFGSDNMGGAYFYDSSKEIIKLFACKHTFHIRCLKKHYKTKYDEVEEIFTRKFEKLRCPTCNLKNYDIENENKRGRLGQANNKTIKQNVINTRIQAGNQDDAQFGSNNSSSNRTNSMNLSDDPIERKIQARQYRMTMKSQTLINRQLQKLTKQMQYFEGSKDSEGLMIKDFKKL
eukprot:403331615